MEREAKKTSDGFEIKHLRHIQIIGLQSLGGGAGAPPPGSASEHFFNTFLINLERFQMQMHK